MKSSVVASGLAIVLGIAGVGTIGFPELAVAQQQTNELSKAIAEGDRLFTEGSAASLRKAIGQFEKALELARLAKSQDKQASSLVWLGFIYNSLGENQKAIDYYNQSLPITRAVGDRSGEARTLNNLGNVYDSLGEKQKASDYYNQSLPITRAVGDRSVEATTLNNLGTIYDSLGEKQKAIDYYNQSLPITRAVGDRSGEATNLNNLGLVYDSLGEKQKAIDYYNQSLPILRAVGNRSGEATTLNNLGLVYSSLGEKQKAIEYYNQSLPILRVVGNRSMEATTLNNLGAVYGALGEKQKAIEYYNQSLPIFRAVGNRSMEATTLNNLGYVYDSLGEKQKAIKYYNQSLPIFRAVGNRSGEAGTLNNLGLVYDSLGEKQKAIDYYNQALPILRAVGNRSMEATTLNNLGAVYDALGEKQKAIDYYNQALSILRAVGNRSVEASTLNNLGSVYDLLGEKQKAIDYFNQALPISRAVGDRSMEATTLNNLGSVYNSLGEKQKAIDYYNQSLPISRTVSNRSVEAATLNNLGFLLDSQKQPELAIVFFKQSISQYEILRQNIRTLPKETQETYTKTVESTYRKLASLLLKADRILEAQQILDLLKIQELNLYLKNVRSGTQELYVLAPETEILKKYGELQTTAIGLGQTLTTLRQIPEPQRTQLQNQEIDRLVQLQTELNQQFNQFLDRPDIQKLITALSPKTLRQTVDTAQLDALRSKLKTLNAVLIYPLILDDRLELVITTPDSPPLRRTVNVKREELNTAIKDFRDVLQNPREDARPIAQKLYGWLIKPLENDLKATNPKTLIYAPDAQLRYIPLAALHDGTQWLTERYAINHITAQSLTDLTAQPSTIPKILAGAIGPENTTITIDKDTLKLAGLPYTIQEIESIQALQPSARLLKGNDFRLQNLRSKLGDYNILHLATHAALVSKKPENSFILFGTNSYATLRDIESWSLNNFDLVVLSACETGLGGNFGTGGEEILGLGYQFQTRGAKATIASLWKVDDSGTQILMTTFYSALKQGHSKTQALKIAQTALIKNDFKLAGLDRAGARRYISQEEILARSNHPAYWAPFILIGNGL